MTPHEQAIADIRGATSFEQITAVVERFPVATGRTGGALYSGPVGSSHSSEFVDQFKGRSDVAIIDETERAKLLSDKPVETAIREKAESLFRKQGMSPDAATKAAGDFLFGDGKAVSGPTTIENCQWGRASKEFVSTLKGDVAVLATSARPDRVFGQVELKAALANSEVTSIGGIPAAKLRADVAAAHGDTSNVLHEVQERFRADVARDAFVGRDGKLVLSREFADTYHLKGDFAPAAELRANGMQHLTVAESAPVVPRPAPVVPRPAPVEIGPAAPVRPGVPTEEFAPRGGGALAENLGKANVVITAAVLTYDAVRVGRQYGALQASGNAFAANTMVRDEALSTAGSIGGAILLSAGAGAAWGLAGGAETGPGALITGAIGGVVGGVVGAFGGQKLAAELTQRELDTQTGGDGHSYTLEGGRWTERHTFSADRPAPAGEIPRLEMQRAEKITDLVLAHPPKPDPNSIETTDPATKEKRTYERRDGAWETTHWSGLHRVTETAPPALAARLNEASAQRDFIGKHGTEITANAFVADYYGKGWDKLGPLPQSVATALKLPSETQVVDPVSHREWHVQGNDATHTQLRLAGRFTYNEIVHATGDELKRVLATRDAAVTQNHDYGARLIQRSYDDMVRVATQARVGELRANGSPLPDVTSVKPYDHQPHTGSFVKVSPTEMALHVGRGEYQLLDVARDLNGVAPPEGRTLAVDARGHALQAPTHAIGRP